VSFFKLAHIGLQLKKLAIFTSNVDAKNQSLINHKYVCGALNRQFIAGAVMGWFSFTTNL